MGMGSGEVLPLCLRELVELEVVDPGREKEKKKALHSTTSSRKESCDQLRISSLPSAPNFLISTR